MKNLLIYFRIIAILSYSVSLTPIVAQQRNNDKTVYLQKKKDIKALMLKLSSVCNGQSIFGTKPLSPDNDIHKIIFIGDDAESWNWNLPDTLLPKQLSEVKFVGCIDNSKEGFGSFCIYTNNIKIKRFQKQKKISVYNASDGKFVESKTFLGGEPGDCPPITSSSYDTYGSDVIFSDIEVWLSNSITKFPLIELKPITYIKLTSASCSVDVKYEGISNIERGICYSTTKMPTIASNQISNGMGPGSFTCELLNLEKNKTYYVRAYLKNESGKLFYSNEFEFFTQESYGTFIDERDNHKYPWIKIGTQTVMTENLAYQPSSGVYHVNDNDQNDVNKFGYLYDWKTAKQVAPKGWHLPSKEEWETLYKYLGGDLHIVYDAIKVGGTSGFNALLRGSFSNNGVFGTGVSAGFWSATSDSDNMTYFLSVYGKENSGWVRVNFDYRNTGYSVRLFRDN